MDFSNVDPGHFSPRLVSVGVVIQKLVTEHQSYSQEPVFAPGLASNCWVELLQSVDEEKS